MNNLLKNVVFYIHMDYTGIILYHHPSETGQRIRKHLILKDTACGPHRHEVPANRKAARARYFL